MFTRSTTATYIDSTTGLVTTAAINEARFETEGLLMEGASTNICLHSEDFSNAVWTSSGAGSSRDTISHTTPDGSGTTDRLTVGTAASDRWQQVLSGTGTFTYSVYLAVESGSLDIRLNMVDGGASVGTKTVTLTTEWQRFDTTTTISTSLDRIELRNTTSGTAKTFLAWGAQVEALDSSTSYKPTVGSPVPRAADRFDIPASNWVALNNDYSVGITLQIDNTADEINAVSFAGVTGDTDLGVDSSNQARFRHNGVATTGSVLGSTETRILGTWKNSGNQNLYLNGLLDAGPTSTTNASGALTAIHIGSNSAGANPIYGHITDLRIYGQELSAGQALNDFLFGSIGLTVNQQMYDSLTRLGFSGTVNDMQLQWMITTNSITEGSLRDRWITLFDNNAVSAGGLADRQREYFESVTSTTGLGFNELKRAFWLAQ